MTTNLCSARKVNACAERGSKYWRFSTTSTCSLKRRRREEYQSFPRKSAKKRRNTQNARVQQKPSRTSKSYDRAKRKQKLLKRDENSRKRETYRKSQAAKERGNFARRLIDLTNSVNQRLLTRATSAKFISFMTAPLDRFSVWELTNDSNNVLKAFQ